MASNEIRVVFRTVDKKCSYKFTPKVSHKTISDHYKNLMDNFSLSLCELLDHIDTLRPATQEERGAHIYVFRTDDENDTEHRLYKIRKQLYDDLTLLFSSILRQEFPDIEYINECAKYLQEFSFDNPDDKDFKEHVAEVTKEVRENYDKILGYLMSFNLEKDNGQKEEEKHTA